MTRINHLTGVKTLLAAWSDQFHSANANPGQMRVGKLGHINVEGTPEAQAHTYSRYNPLFIQSLEPGIRALVVAMINRFDCVTYSSCEGHRSEDGSVVASFRSIGVLPRDEEESTLLKRDLENLITRTHENWTRATHLKLVSSELKTEYGVIESIDLIFEAGEIAPSQYFNEADDLSQRLLHLLNYD